MSSKKTDVSSEPMDDLLLVQYLLGNLSPEEQARIEDRTFADPDYLATLQAVEVDLIDAYVNGELSPADRRGFERQFLVSPERRKKVAFARDLAHVAAEAKAVEASPALRVSAWQSFLRAVRGWNPALQFAAGLAVVILLAGVSWLTVENVTMRSRIAGMETQSRELQSRTEELRRQLDLEQARSGTLAAQVQQQGTAARGPVSAAASLVLLPGLSRAESRRDQLVLSPTTGIAHIEVQLEARDDYPRFRAELRTLSGVEVVTLGSLSRRQVSGGYAVSFDVPASALASDQYELTLKGVLNDQTAQDVGFYYFSVLKQ
jgi:anti-sigma factor RsiW